MKRIKSIKLILKWLSNLMADSKSRFPIQSKKFDIKLHSSIRNRILSCDTHLSSLLLARNQRRDIITYPAKFLWDDFFRSLFRRSRILGWSLIQYNFSTLELLITFRARSERYNINTFVVESNPQAVTVFTHTWTIIQKKGGGKNSRWKKTRV